MTRSRKTQLTTNLVGRYAHFLPQVCNTLGQHSIYRQLSGQSCEIVSAYLDSEGSPIFQILDESGSLRTCYLTADGAVTIFKDTNE